MEGVGEQAEYIRVMAWRNVGQAPTSSPITTHYPSGTSASQLGRWTDGYKPHASCRRGKIRSDSKLLCMKPPRGEVCATTINSDLSYDER